MTLMEFQRARTDDQREQRRQLILETARAMLSEMPVSALSLNELSRRVGLAKSNVLRYFETREAILLNLLNEALDEWAREIATWTPLRGDARTRIDELSKLLAESLTTRPLLCDLASAQASVLERNVSTEVVLQHKRAIRETVLSLSDTLKTHLPELTDKDALHAISVLLLMTSACWPQATPTQALLDAYKEDPQLGDMHLSFADYLCRTLETCLSGILARHQQTVSS